MNPNWGCKGSFSNAVSLLFSLTQMSWKIRQTESVVAMLVTVPLKYHLYWVRRRLEPVILDRLRAYPNSSEKGATRADGIGWAVNVAVDSQGTLAIDASDILH